MVSSSLLQFSMEVALAPEPDDDETDDYESDDDQTDVEMALADAPPAQVLGCSGL